MTKSLRLFIALGAVVVAYSFAVMIFNTRGDDEIISAGGEIFELETLAETEDLSYFPPVEDGLGALQAATPIANPGGGAIAKNTVINIETPTPGTHLFGAITAGPPIDASRAGELNFSYFASKGVLLSDATLYLYAWGPEFSPSNIAVYYFTIVNDAAPPVEVTTPPTPPPVIPTPTAEKTPTPEIPVNKEKIGANYEIKTDGFSFLNDAKSFNYPKYYNMPYEIMMEVLEGDYGYAKADLMSRTSRRTWIGHCVGMAAVSGIFFNGELNAKNYMPPGVETVYYIPPPGSATAPLTQLFEKYQCAQHRKTVVEIRGSSNLSDVPKNAAYLVDATKKFMEDGKSPIIAGVYPAEGTGHAVMPYKVSQTASGYHISVYDSNIPGLERDLFISKNLGSFSFSFNGTTNFSSRLTGFPVSALDQNLNLSDSDGFEEADMIVVPQAGQVEITDSYGRKLEEIPGAIESWPLGAGYDSPIYYLPEGEYIVYSPNGGAIDISANNINAHIETTSEASALVNFNDSPFVSISTPNGDDIVLNVESFKPEIKSFSFSGSIEEIFAAQLSGDEIKLFGEFEQR
jgi:hypothetical protein